MRRTNGSRWDLRVAWLCLGVVGLLVGRICAQDPVGADKGTIRGGLYYGATPIEQADDYQKERCVLDLYLPAEAKGFATIVWFQEGDFRSGSRQIPDVFRGRGLAIAAPDYRLTPNVACERAIGDAAQAAAYVLTTIEGLGGDPARVFVAGSGTGGYLAGLVALDRSLLAACGLEGAKVAGLVCVNGTACTHPVVVKERGG